MNIKVCGMKYKDNISDVAQLAIDYMGFIFYPKSPRFVDNLDLITTLEQIPDNIIKIGVFVNEKIEDIISICAHYHLDGVQLHGQESPSLCQRLKNEGLYVIKVIHVKNNQLTLNFDEYQIAVDAFIFDCQVGDQIGGTGQSFDWGLIEKINLTTPFLISGGINSAKSSALNQITHPYFKGVDINSGFEIKPGLKKVDLIQEFISKIK